MKFELFKETTGICIDTRKIEKDCLFVCLKGENFDGNNYAQEAINKGAKYVISDDTKNDEIDNVYIVEDSLKYLQNLANYHRNQFDIPIIGITGTNGKTTSKELINHVLKQKFNVLATTGNLNNHIGVPLTLLSIKKEHQIAIIEMGANKPGDIKELVEIAEPTHCIITNIGKAHLEGFKSYEGVIKTKGEMYEYAKKHNSVIFYNNEDDLLKSIIPNSVTSIPYSLNATCNLIRMSPYVCMCWETNGYTSGEIETKMIGKYNYTNFIAAITIGKYFEVDNAQISDAIKTYEPTNNRSQVQKSNKNTLILDAYNANPSSMKNAIESFQEIQHIEKLLILGDMFELGDVSKTEHLQIVNTIIEKKLACYFIGENFHAEKQVIENCTFFETKTSLIEFLKKYPIENKLILLKASRGIGLEEIVNYL